MTLTVRFLSYPRAKVPPYPDHRAGKHGKGTEMRDFDLLGSLTCRQPEHDPDLWTDDDTVERARSLCSTCPAVDQCLDFATDPAHADLTGAGVWGGKSARCRGAMMKVRAANLTIGHRYQTVTLPRPRVSPEVGAFRS